MQGGNLEIIVEDLRTQSENTLPWMLMGLRSELPLAGNPQELQSGPIMLMELACMLMAIHTVSLGKPNHSICENLGFDTQACFTDTCNTKEHKARGPQEIHTSWIDVTVEAGTGVAILGPNYFINPLK